METLTTEGSTRSTKSAKPFGEVAEAGERTKLTARKTAERKETTRVIKISPQTSVRLAQKSCQTKRSSSKLALLGASSYMAGQHKLSGRGESPHRR